MAEPNATPAAAAAPPQVTLSSKEIKKLARPIFDANPDQYYPTNVFRRWGFQRAECPKCHHHFWRHSDKQTVCGDSACVGSYRFIGKGVGVGAKGRKITYADAWNGFKRSFETAPIPHTAINRYPVVARWRDDVDFVAAGIFCFQPYCVTGELDPPANPLICSQFCLRFNDLDSIGLSGRHYSGFNMLGIQVFNKPDKFIYFKEEIIEFNLRWLTQTLEINPDDICFIEDVWAGGGNLGPCVEYFIEGMEVGNMVFMQFKTFPNGTWEPLKVQVIDVGIGLERIPFLVNGSPTSYTDVFPEVLEYLQRKLEISFNSEIWTKYGPYACLLNIDECEDINATWELIAQKINVPRAELMAAVEPFRDLFVVADHTRTIQIALYDGALPCSTGGGSNLRNVLRRVFDVLHRRGWWDKLGMEGLMEIFRLHRVNLAQIYGPFEENKSFEKIIQAEYDKWLHTDVKIKAELDRMMKKSKGAMTPADWLRAMTTYGIDPGKISEFLGVPVPPTLYADVAELQEKNALRAKEQQTGGAQLYSNDTVVLPATDEMTYSNQDPATRQERPVDLSDFDARILAVLAHHESHQFNQVVLDRTKFYPLSGGQDHDTGALTIEGIEGSFKVAEVSKSGHCVLHRIEPALTAEQVSAIKGRTAHCHVDAERRRQLMAHHTATHLIHYAAHKVLGPHVWQASAKKTIEEAHLDITHFLPLTPEEEQAIEREANLAIFAAAPITKYHLPKEEAERRYGFQLYQGGVVPGKEVRVVEVQGFDIEACCGTHCDNTAQVGMIRLIRTHRVSDGAVRLHFVAGLRALQHTQTEAALLRRSCEVADVLPEKLVDTIKRFFDDSKALQKREAEIPELQLRVLAPPTEPMMLIRTQQADATMFKSLLPNYATRLRETGRAVAVVGPSWVYGILGWPTAGVTAAPKKPKKGEAAAPAPEAAAAPAPAPAAAPAASAGARFDPHVLEPLVAVPNADGKKGKLMLQPEVKPRGGAAIEGVTEFVSFIVAKPDTVEKALTDGGFKLLQ